MIDPVKLVIGILLGSGIAFVARKLHALSRSGMWAAAILGSIIMGIGGLRWAVLLMGFFISSSVLSRLFKSQKAALEGVYAKGGERDAGQVLANGGIAGIFVLLYLVFPESSLPWMGFAGALAAANADTWATELGALSPTPPRLITTFRKVTRGTSGGVTLTGTFAAAAGSAVIGLLAVLFWPPEANNPGLALSLAVITLAGLAGSLVDSLLGARLQAIYRCDACNKETERHPFHNCGSPTTLQRGLSWLNNDWVNTICTLTGALLAVLPALV